ncbi:MAG: hypothetical protein WCA35_24890 [Kovacikia sp.]
MKFITNQIVIGLLFGLLTLSPSIQPASADPLLSEEGMVETSDPNESSPTRKVVLVAGRDRPSPGISDKVANLNQIANGAKTIYNLVKADNWAEANTQLASLQETMLRLKANNRVSKADFAHLNALIMALKGSVSARHHQAMYDTNQLAMTAVQLAKQSNPQIQVEVAMLDYYGRELEIWSERGNTAKLKTVADRINQTWSSLRPEIQTLHVPAQVQQFDDTLVALVQTATSPTEYRLLATPLLVEVNNLQRLFQLSV